jgi:hypothetical protein
LFAVSRTNRCADGRWQIVRYSDSIRPVLNTGQSVPIDRFIIRSQPRGRPSRGRVWNSGKIEYFCRS